MLLNNNKPVDAQSVNAVIISLQNELKRLSNKVDSKEVKTEEEVKPIDVNFDKIYPVGTIYTSINDTNPSTYFGGKWVSLGGGRVLQGATEGQTGGETIEPALPNIVGTYSDNSGEGTVVGTGAFKKSRILGGQSIWLGTPQVGAMGVQEFNASDSNSIYKDNVNTVQPPALIVHFFKRIA